MNLNLSVLPNLAFTLMVSMFALSKTQRLEKIVDRLLKAPQAATDTEALQQLADVITSVEDQFTSIPNNPTRWQNDGRLYPPQADSRREVSHTPSVKRYRSRGHNTFIGINGAIEIQAISGHVLLSKSGRNGRTVWQP